MAARSSSRPGGIGDAVGFSACVHLFGEPWTYNYTADTWRVASWLPHPTCGLAALSGQWGGAASVGTVIVTGGVFQSGVMDEALGGVFDDRYFALLR